MSIFRNLNAKCDRQTDGRTPTRHKHNPRLRHSQNIITLRPNRVFTRRIVVSLGIDPRNDAESGKQLNENWTKYVTSRAFYAGFILRGLPRVGNGSMQLVEIDRIVIRDVQYQFEVNLCRNEEVNFQGSMARTEGRTNRRRR
ncbi:hypothetical protein DPMN_001176 [Dreissena polymorpha]|uniref:Uncharacterized protein n=1 Tax=Dreissena polymorpha TaxID=45954 RepID=A0A9D4MIV5_DREPO|nr:hypothetical protein DPMN_001176 [Dreissena polymorpha]